MIEIELYKELSETQISSAIEKSKIIGSHAKEEIRKTIFFNLQKGAKQI